MNNLSPISSTRSPGFGRLVLGLVAVGAALCSACSARIAKPDEHAPKAAVEARMPNDAPEHHIKLPLQIEPIRTGTSFLASGNQLGEGFEGPPSLPLHPRGLVLS